MYNNQFHFLNTSLKKIIYVLKLENDKYYVGHLRKYEGRPKTPIKTRFASVSEWTRKYKPIEIIRWFAVNDLFVKDAIVMRYMYKFGTDNVRGGTFVEEKLKDDLLNYIKLVFATVDDKCFECNKKGHFASAHAVDQDEHT